MGERARIAAEEREEKTKAKAVSTPSSKHLATGGQERTLKENVARAWGFVIAANSKEKLLNWRPGRRKAPESDVSEVPDIDTVTPVGREEASAVPFRKEENSVAPPSVPHVVIPPVGVIRPIMPVGGVQAKPKPTTKDPWSSVNLGNAQEILNTHPNVHQDLCWNFMKGGCAKGVRCNWRHPAY